MAGRDLRQGPATDEQGHVPGNRFSPGQEIQNPFLSLHHVHPVFAEDPPGSREQLPGGERLRQLERDEIRLLAEAGRDHE